MSIKSEIEKYIYQKDEQHAKAVVNKATLLTHVSDILDELGGYDLTFTGTYSPSCARIIVQNRVEYFVLKIEDGYFSLTILHLFETITDEKKWDAAIAKFLVDNRIEETMYRKPNIAWIYEP